MTPANPARRLRLEPLEDRLQPSTVGVPPRANDDIADTDGNNPVTVDVLENDAGQNPLDHTKVKVVSGPAKGTVAVDPVSGEVTYTATGFAQGSDQFRYTVTDSLGLVSNPATVTIVINRPTANDDFADTDGNNPVMVDVLENDTDPDGNQFLDPASVKVVSQPAHGTLSIDPATGEITYTAIGSFTGTDTFQYTVADTPGAVSAPGTVTIVVNRPTANDDPATTTAGTAVAVDVLANDTDPDGNQFLDPASVSVLSGPAHGTVSVDPSTGEITYTPAAGFTGSDQFQYTVTDSPGAVSNPATVRVRVGFVAGSQVVVTGSGQGAAPLVNVYKPDGTLQSSFNAFDPTFTGGVRVAEADFNGDGLPDIVAAAGPGGGPHVRVFDGKTGTELKSFFAYAPTFSGGMTVAVGDVNGDGTPDIITGAGAGGGPHVKVFDGKTGAELKSFFAYDAGFTGGVSVAAADIDGDGKDDVITGAGAGGSPHVKVFSGADGTVLRSFFAYDAGFKGGVNVAAADLNGDGFADILTGAGAGGGPHVKAFSGTDGSLLVSTFGFASTATGGVRLTAEDVNADGQTDVIVAPASGSGTVTALDGATFAPLGTFPGSNPTFLGGVFVGGYA